MPYHQKFVYHSVHDGVLAEECGVINNFVGSQFVDHQQGRLSVDVVEPTATMHV